MVQSGGDGKDIVEYWDAYSGRTRGASSVIIIKQ